MEECPSSGAVPQTGLTGLQLPNHRAQGLWSASQFECGPATISGTGTRSVFGVLSYLVRAPARVPALWDWCQAFNSPRAEAPRPGGHFCSRCSAPWAPGSLGVPAAEHTPGVPAALCPSPAATESRILSPREQAGKLDNAWLLQLIPSFLPPPPAHAMAAAPKLCSVKLLRQSFPKKCMASHSQYSQGSPAPVLPTRLC